MSIRFDEIYAKAISLFDDPKITIAYETNKIQFCKIMYTYLQNAIALFTNPSIIGVILSEYKAPLGVLETFESNGESTTFTLDPTFELIPNSEYSFIANGEYITGEIDYVERTVTFSKSIPLGEEFALEQYFVGEFTGDFNIFDKQTLKGLNLILGEVKDILARLLVKAWAEGERNDILDIRNLMQDSDFKILGNDKVLRSKDMWVDQLDTEILQLQNKLAWNITFMGKIPHLGK